MRHRGRVGRRGCRQTSGSARPSSSSPAVTTAPDARKRDRLWSEGGHRRTPRSCARRGSATRKAPCPQRTGAGSGSSRGQGRRDHLLACGDLALEHGPARAGGRRLCVLSFADGVLTHVHPGSGYRGTGRWLRRSGARSSRVRLRSSASAPTTSRWCRSTTPRPWPTIRTRPELHERLADALGRSAGAPLFVGVEEEPDGPLKGWRRGVPDDGDAPDVARRRHYRQPSLDCVDDELAGAQAPRVAARQSSSYPRNPGGKAGGGSPASGSATCPE